MTITAKFNGRCKRCGGSLPAGSRIEWTRDSGATHVDPTECAAASRPAEPVTKDARAIAEFLAAARERGLKFPKARFLAPGGGEIRLSVAGVQASVPGSIQVVVRDQWVGRIEPTGRVHGDALVNDAALLAALDVIAADPATAAKAYGALMGRCSFCDLPITDAGSVEVGYGPICAKRFGLPHAPKGTPMLTQEAA